MQSKLFERKFCEIGEESQVIIFRPLQNTMERLPGKSSVDYSKGQWTLHSISYTLRIATARPLLYVVANATIFTIFSLLHAKKIGGCVNFCVLLRFFRNCRHQRSSDESFLSFLRLQILRQLIQLFVWISCQNVYYIMFFSTFLLHFE